MSEFLDQTREIREGEQLDLAQLEPYLRSHLPAAEGPLVVEQFPAGHSNLTYSVRLGEYDLVLRRPPFGSKVKAAHDMGREFRVLSKLHGAYPPAPQPLLYCDDTALLGAPFYVMHRIRGVIIRKELPPGMLLPPDAARRLSESFIDNLAALHALDYAAIGLGDLGKPEGYMRRQVEGWIKRYCDSQTEEIPEVEPIGRWLTEHVPERHDAALIHNDYKFDNVVVADEDVTRIIGVLDWEMATLGDPLSDLGTAIGYWIDPGDPDELQWIRWGPTTVAGMLTRRELVDQYAAKTGRDTSGIAFYYVYAMFKTAVIGQQIYYRFHHGLTKDPRFAFFIEATKIMMRTALRVAESGRI